jgi:hypothetical protein
VTAGDGQISGFTGAGAASPMLTVWRKLHIEQDSMRAVPQQPPSPDSGKIFGPIWSLDTPSVGKTTISGGGELEDVQTDFYRGGYAWPALSGPEQSYEIFGNNDSSDDAILLGEPTPDQRDPSNVWFIYDDDGRGLNGGNSPVLPEHGLISEGVVSKYMPAYIHVLDVEELSLNPRKTVDYDNNISDFEVNTNTFSVNDSEDLASYSDDKLFWNQLVVASHQPSESIDGDPIFLDPEIGSGENANNAFSPSVVMIFLEGIRENFWASFMSSNPDELADANIDYRALLDVVVAHEIGHSAGGMHDDSHNEGGIMGKDYDGDYFTPQTILRFRNANSWR